MAFLRRTTGSEAVDILEGIAAFLFNYDCAIKTHEFYSRAEDVSSAPGRPLRKIRNSELHLATKAVAYNVVTLKSKCLLAQRT